MNKDNKYYNLIETLVKNHKKFPGYEAILDEIIDDVFSHSEVIISSIDNESVIKAYLEKVIATSIITVPKQLNYHNELRHRTINTVLNTVQQEDKLPEQVQNIQEIEQPVANELIITQQEPSDEEFKIFEDKEEVELVEEEPLTEDVLIEESLLEENIIKDAETDLVELNAVQKANPIYVDNMINSIEPVSVDVIAPEGESDDLYENLNDADADAEEEEEIDSFSVEKEPELELKFESNYGENVQSDAETFVSDIEENIDESVLSDVEENVSDEILTFDDTYSENIEENCDTELVLQEENQNDDFEPVEDVINDTEDVNDTEDAVLSEDSSLVNNEEELFADTEEPIIEELQVSENDNFEVLESNDLGLVDSFEEDIQSIDSGEQIFDDIDDLLPQDDNLVEKNLNEEFDDFELVENDVSLSLGDDENNNPNEEVAFSSYIQTDYSVFSYSPELKSEILPNEELGTELLQLNKENSKLHILEVFDLRYKQNKKISDIAIELGMASEDVVNALNEMARLV